VTDILDVGDVLSAETVPVPGPADFARARLARETLEKPTRDVDACAAALRLALLPHVFVEALFDAFGSAFVADVLQAAMGVGQTMAVLRDGRKVYWPELRRNAGMDCHDALARLVLARLTADDVARLDPSVTMFVAIAGVVRKTRGLTIDTWISFSLRAAYALVDEDDRHIRERDDLAEWLRSSLRDRLVAMFGERTSARIVAALREARAADRKVSFTTEMKILTLVGGETNARAIAEMLDYRPVAKHAAAFFAKHPALAPKTLGSASKQASVVLRVAKTTKKKKKLPPFVTSEALAMLPTDEAEDLVLAFASDPQGTAWRIHAIGHDLEAFFLEVATAWHALGANMRAKWPVHGLAHVGTLPCVHWLVPIARQWEEAGLRSGIELACDAFKRIAVSENEGAGVALLQLAALADSKHGYDEGLAGRAFTTLGEVAGILRMREDALRWDRFPSFGLDEAGRGVLRGVAWSLGPTLEATFAKSTTLTKNVQKDIETFARVEERRFFELMLRGTRIDLATFQRACVLHPVRRHLAARLVWSIDGMLVRIAEDGSLETVDRAQHVPLEGAEAWIPHPIRMGDRRAWAERFADYEVVPLLDQLARPVFHADDTNGTELPRYHGRRLDVAALRGSDLPFTGSDTYLRWGSFIVEARDGIVSRVHAFFRRPVPLSSLSLEEISEVCLALERATS
jgi:hypothetical protein